MTARDRCPQAAGVASSSEIRTRHCHSDTRQGERQQRHDHGRHRQRRRRGRAIGRAALWSSRLRVTSLWSSRLRVTAPWSSRLRVTALWSSRLRVSALWSSRLRTPGLWVHDGRRRGDRRNRSTRGTARAGLTRRRFDGPHRGDRHDAGGGEVMTVLEALHRVRGQRSVAPVHPARHQAQPGERALQRPYPFRSAAAAIAGTRS